MTFSIVEDVTTQNIPHNIVYRRGCTGVPRMWFGARLRHPSHSFLHWSSRQSISAYPFVHRSPLSLVIVMLRASLFPHLFTSLSLDSVECRDYSGRVFLYSPSLHLPSASVFRQTIYIRSTTEIVSRVHTPTLSSSRRFPTDFVTRFRRRCFCILLSTSSCQWCLPLIPTMSTLCTPSFF
jgi:hypothetical protein